MLQPLLNGLNASHTVRPTKVGIHDFAARAKTSHGWRAFARHDDGRRPESRDLGLLVLECLVSIEDDTPPARAWPSWLHPVELIAAFVRYLEAPSRALFAL